MRYLWVIESFTSADKFGWIPEDGMAYSSRKEARIEIGSLRSNKVPNFKYRIRKYIPDRRGKA